MSKPAVALDPLMNTPTLICCPTGPPKTGGAAGQGFGRLALAVGSARQTSPVIGDAWTRGISTGTTKTIERSRIGSKTRILLLDSPRHLSRLELCNHSI